MRTIFAAGIAAALVTGCAAQNNVVWLRTDGQRMTGNAVLTQQLDVDKTICDGEGRKANMEQLTGDIGRDLVKLGGQAEVVKGCMAGKGYVLVPTDQVEARSQEFAAIAAQKQAQQVPQSSASPKQVNAR